MTKKRDFNYEIYLPLFLVYTCTEIMWLGLHILLNLKQKWSWLLLQ